MNSQITRKQVFLAQMQHVVPWASLSELIAPSYSEGRNGRPPFALETMLRVHSVQQYFSLSDLAIEETFFDIPLYREFAQINVHDRLPNESTILRFRHRLERHKLADQALAIVNHHLSAQRQLFKAGTAVDATLIAVPSSTKNKYKAQDPEMYLSQKGRQWYFGMKVHIAITPSRDWCAPRTGPLGVWRTSLRATARCVVERRTSALQTTEVADKHPDAKKDVTWHVAMRSGKRRALDKNHIPANALIDQLEKIKSCSIRTYAKKILEI